MTRPAFAAALYDSDDYPHGEEWDLNMTGKGKWLTAAEDFGLVSLRSRRGTAAESMPEVAA